MRFLLTNDDGIDAAGLKALERAVASLGEYIVLAPHVHQSGCSHQATTSRPLALSEVGSKRYMLDGSPADCTRIGLTQLATDADWVLAGINEGANLGADVYLSGTVAAAREACLMGKPAIAVSQYVRQKDIDWETASVWTQHVLQLLLNRPPTPGTLWNVNLPQPDHSSAKEIPECVMCPLDPNPLPIHYERTGNQFVYRGVYHQRSRIPGSDLDCCFNGQIALTQISLAGAISHSELRVE